MSQYILVTTKSTPKIVFNADKNYLLIEGRSLPEDTKKFYKQVENWLRYFKPKNGAVITIEMKFSYVNTSSMIALIAIIKKLKAISENGCKLKINWFYEKYDDDMVSKGEDIAGIIKIVDFNFIEM